MKEGFKKDLLRGYALVFLIFAFFSSCVCMHDILMDIPFLHNIDRMDEILFGAVFFLHIGTVILIASGRLKDKD